MDQVQVSGVMPQGWVLSPVLNVFNYLEEGTGSMFIKFVDGTKLGGVTNKAVNIY